jgi:hypothetical protein
MERVFEMRGGGDFIELPAGLVVVASGSAITVVNYEVKAKPAIIAKDI